MEILMPQVRKCNDVPELLGEKIFKFSGQRRCEWLSSEGKIGMRELCIEEVTGVNIEK
jgi:hypothetical protein